VQPATGPHPPPDRHGPGLGAPGDPIPPAGPCLSLLPATPPAAAVPARRIYLEVEAHPAVVSQARRFTRSTLGRWGLGDASSDAELIVSELLTNAIVATERMPFGAQVGLLITADPRQLLLLVWDASPEPPIRQDPDPDTPEGRGLQIIEALGARWGSSADSRGKVVWAALEIR
jgi:anti-sigma regulatory factor (Ser/Thr protein kinase)